MNRITIGLDFGTHQTKICVENKVDKYNPTYSFFSFEDLEGNKSIILPSIIQINKDNTLSYGFVEKEDSKYGKKFDVGCMPKYPQKHEIVVDEIVPMPIKPNILSLTATPMVGNMVKFQLNYEKAKKTYETQLALWNQRKVAQEVKRNRLIKEMDLSYQNELKEWYRWQNLSQINHRMIYRYFKQSTFSDYKWNCTLQSSYLSVWYLSFIIFHLEKKYGQDFAIQMGIPTGSENFEMKKRNAVSLLLTAYHIVEDVFQNDLVKFLSTPIKELERLTIFLPYSEEKKVQYGLLIFPEAYAGLKSLTSRGKIEQGMSLMVDIGGGTTDMTFFTIENNAPKIYDYSSIPFGLNFIVETAMPNLLDKFEANLNLNDIEVNVLVGAIKQYYLNLQNACDGLIGKLRRSFECTEFPINKLMDALRNRTVIYSGGGSTYEQLRKSIEPFSDIKHILPIIWEGMTIDEVDKYISLCPIISTSLGLAISEINDNVELSSTEEIFKHLEGAYEVKDKPRARWV